MKKHKDEDEGITAQKVHDAIAKIIPIPSVTQPINIDHQDDAVPSILNG